ncbi:Sphingoid long-chain base transporter [Lachnellula hyalina]|uniref:Sphingoid long-chain base transporter n=1 Tax=Lachnellula hyalina TaxID=1316788 RepID=A0A8H8TXC4_9HELO|nr:Sphingoid long-chain base transporter [Lachnellula hyalina]TVY23782.1 Sphingoid long-chain base transporter [Lachnellula hyalina]
MASLIHELVARRTKDQFAACTLDTCPISSSYYFYRVSLAANATFLALFAISFIGFAVTFALTRRALAFTVAMLIGVILEVIGYVGRIESNKNQWQENGFLMQIVCLTIAPAFLAGGIYLCLRRIVYAFGPENSRISPEAYTRIFIPCDLVSLLLQAAGGGLASAESHSNKSPDTGDNIMVAGLAFQVLTLLIFMVLCVDFAIRTRRRYKSMGESAFDQNPLYVSLRGSWRFKGFIAALTLATICIFWRSVYRVAELGEGWTGNLIRRQWLFVGFEGVMVIVACFALNLFNPAFSFKEAMNGLGGLGSKKRIAKQENQEKAVSGSNSDVEAVPQAKTVGI